MKALLDAIASKVNEENPSNNAFYTSISGRFYNTKAEQNISFPYCVMHLINDVEDSTLTELMDDFIIQFSIYSNTEDDTELNTIFENLKTLFDDVFLTVSGYENFSMQRQFSRPLWIPEEKVWQYIAEYTTITKKN